MSDGAGNAKAGKLPVAGLLAAKFETRISAEGYAPELGIPRV